jgi:hypothetical protein
MNDFLLFIVASMGMTLIITRGEIFKEFRGWVLSFAPVIPLQQPTKFLANGTPDPDSIPPIPTLTPCQYLRKKIANVINCCQCTGFWCGIFCGIWYVYYRDVPNGVIDGLLKMFLCGCVGSVSSLTIDVCLEYLYRHK